MSGETTEALAVIGVVSDTHGPVSGSLLQALTDVDFIIHAGDIVGEDVIDRLSRVAPVTAVRGNMDGRGAASGLPWTALADIEGVSFYVLHDLYDLDIDPVATGVAAVIHGHTHRADVSWRDGVLYLNPGSARGSHATYARITVTNEGIKPKIVEVPSPSTHQFRSY